ncbi:branched-chain amino acid transport system II carrier protein, partial [Enterococcus lactis]|nr:branched-chain amino acid transport system II carrier protein [Enterococcus lactis]
HLTIGPFFGIPRTAATAFEMAAKPFLPEKYNSLGMFLFSALFFLLAYFLTVHPTRLVKYVGKYLNSLFLALLAIIFVVSLFHPMGNLNQSAADTYQTNALTNGVLEGYNTVDAVALLALSVTFVHAVRDLGFKDKKVTELTAKAGSLSVALEVMIYFGLVLLGAMSLNKMSLSENGGTALSQITNFYLGNFGASFLGVMVTLGVFTTAMGLVVSFAQDFHKLFPKVSYMTWLRLTTFVSFVVANAGLDNIIQWSLPVLMLLYPLSLALILLSLTAKFFQKTPFVYQVTMLFAAVPAVLDMLANSPALVSQQRVVASMLEFYHHHVPFAALGLGWIVPTLLGYAGSLLFYYAYRLSGYK